MGPGCGGRAGTASVAQPLATIASPKHTAHRRRAALLHPLEQRSRRRRPWVGVVLSRVRRPLAQRDAVGALPRIGDAAVAKHHIPPRKLLRGRGRGRDEGVLAADRSGRDKQLLHGPRQRPRPNQSISLLRLKRGRPDRAHAGRGSGDGDQATSRYCGDHPAEHLSQRRTGSGSAPAAAPARIPL